MAPGLARENPCAPARGGLLKSFASLSSKQGKKEKHTHVFLGAKMILGEKAVAPWEGFEPSAY